jgi:hypothetical protein
VRGSRGVAATRYGWCMHNRFADKPSNSLSRNILRISPLKSKILQEFLPKPLIPIDTKIKSFSPKSNAPFLRTENWPFSSLQKFVPVNVKLRISPRTQLEQIHSLQFAFARHPLPVDAIQRGGIHSVQSVFGPPSWDS